MKSVPASSTTCPHGLASLESAAVDVGPELDKA